MSSNLSYNTMSGPADPQLIPLEHEPAAISDSPEYGILRAVVHAATSFLQKTELDASLNQLLSRIGSATGASRVTVFQNNPRSDNGVATATQCAEWAAEGITTHFGTPLVENISLNTDGFEHWFSAFARGEPFVAVTADLPDGPRERLQEAGVLSLAAAPIFVKQEFWGFIGVDNCVESRLWSPVEVDALAAAAIVVGAAIQRQHVQEELSHATTKAQLAADIGEVVTRAGDTLQEMLDRCSAAVVRRLNPDLVRIWMMSESLDCLIACTAAGARSIQQPGPGMPMVSDELMHIAAHEHPTTWAEGLPKLWPGCEEEYATLDLRAGIGFPLVTNGRVAGVAVLLGREMPDAAMVDAFDSVTDEIALAIERHHARAAETRAENRYRRLVSVTVEGIVIHDGQRVVDANPSFSAMLGYTPEEVIGMDPFAFIGPEYHEFVMEQLKANAQQPYEVEGIHKDGRRFPVELKGDDYYDNGMKLRVAAVRDITDRKNVERTSEELRQEQQARAIAERTREDAEFLGNASRILASSLDTATTIAQLAHLAIPKLADYCLVTTGEVDGFARQKFAVHSDPEMEPLLRAALATWPEKMPEGNPINEAVTQGRHYLAPKITPALLDKLALSPTHRDVLNKLGSHSLLAVPIMSNGAVLGAMVLNITKEDRRYGEDEIALAQEFAHRAGQALQSARSYLAAQAATRARDEMLAVVAHDLRNPLNTIFMGSELALEMLSQTTSESSPGVRQLEIIRRSAEHMNRLIQDLLDASRIDSGNLGLEKSALTAAALLREAADMLSPIASHENISFEQRADASLPTINGDKGRLLQVLSNLVGNAIKFTPKGGQICIVAGRCRDLITEQDAIQFSVQDTGPGIPAEQLPHIFGRFWQAHHADRRGIGLGLAIASGIVAAHGGRIWVDSVVGEGSTFHFTVPLEN